MLIPFSVRLWRHWWIVRTWCYWAPAVKMVFLCSPSWFTTLRLADFSITISWPVCSMICMGSRPGEAVLVLVHMQWLVLLYLFLFMPHCISILFLPFEKILHYLTKTFTGLARVRWSYFIWNWELASRRWPTGQNTFTKIQRVFPQRNHQVLSYSSAYHSWHVEERVQVTSTFWWHFQASFIIWC